MSNAPYQFFLAKSGGLRPWMQVLQLQAANGFGQEDSAMVIEGMAAVGAEPTYCMGDDIPLPVLSQRPHVLSDYFKQRFAQVCFNCPPAVVGWGRPQGGRAGMLLLL